VCPGSAAAWKDGLPCFPVERLTQRTVKFIRWLKNHLELERDWNQAMARLSEIYACL